MEIVLKVSGVIEEEDKINRPLHRVFDMEVVSVVLYIIGFIIYNLQHIILNIYY